MSSGRTYGAVAAAVTAIATTLVVTSSAVPADAKAKASTPQVTGLSHHSEPTWGGDWITITGSGFGGTGSHAVSAVWFGPDKGTPMHVIDAHAVEAQDPEIDGARRSVDVVVELKDGTRSKVTKADRFTFTVPTTHTPIHNGWSTVQSRSIGAKVIHHVSHKKAVHLAARSGRWTLAMGETAVKRAKRWLGMPYSWGGGDAHGPTYGTPYGDGLLGRYDATFRGFDCSGLMLYAWSPYKGLPHYSSAQHRVAGRFHPTLSELQPGDLLFFSGGGPTIDHVVMYAGHGKVVEAPWSGHPVEVTTYADALAGSPRYFGATRPKSTGRQGAGPRITHLSVTSGALKGGEKLTIRGKNLATTSRISFGTTTTYAFTIVSSTKVTVTVPARHRGKVNIRLGNAWGVSAKVKADRFTYAKPKPAPTPSPSPSPSPNPSASASPTAPAAPTGS